MKKAPNAEKSSKVLHKKGAEAELTEILFEEKKALSKKRVPKNYRNPILDASIRKERTRSESKLLRSVSSVINAPQVYSVGETDSEIIMEFIEGKALKLVISKNPELAIEAGKCIRKIHDIGVIHGDLTTSNIIAADKTDNPELNKRIEEKGSLFFVDFGLGYFSKKLEDRATDLVVFKKTFNATHSGIKNGWALVMKGYSPDEELIARMEAIEKRARYH